MTRRRKRELKNRVTHGRRWLALRGLGEGRSAVHCIWLLAVLWSGSAAADDARGLVDNGNRAYAGGDFDGALASYEEASVDAPESARIYFNKGAAHYRQENYSEAVEAFQQAALKTKDIWLESRSKFNLGNCAVREAERQRDSDLRKALASYERSILHYQDALELDPDFKEAAENVEIVRLVMKSILDEIKKQEEAQQQQQQAQQQAAEQLKQLIEKQEQTLQKNRQLQEEKKQQDDPDASAGRSRELGSEQRGLSDETQKLADKMQEQAQQQQQQQQAPSPAAEQARQHMDKAVGEQNEAADQLDDNRGAKAEPRQEKAVEELKKALEAMSGEQGQQQQQGQGQQDQGQQDQAQTTPQEQPQQAEDEQAQEQVVPLADHARDILEEEKDNLERRQLPSGAYRPVDKDW